MTTSDFIEAIRDEIKNELRAEILAELKPEIERRLYANIFDVKEAARYRRISEPTLRRMVRDGEIPYFRQRGGIFFRQIDLDKHLASSIIPASQQKGR